MQNFMKIVQGNPFVGGQNSRGVGKYSDVGHVEGDISETVQDTASGTIRRIQWYHSGLSGVTRYKGYKPQI